MHLVSTVDTDLVIQLFVLSTLRGKQRVGGDALRKMGRGKLCSIFLANSPVDCAHQESELYPDL